MKKINLLGFILSLVILVTACGPAEDASTGEATPTSPPEPAPARVVTPASSPGETQEMQITANASGYEPASITVKAGSRIHFVFTNVDNETHDLYNRSLKMETGFAPGATTTYEWTAPQTPGTYTAECTYHEGLTLKIDVVE